MKLSMYGVEQGEIFNTLCQICNDFFGSPLSDSRPGSAKEIQKLSDFAQVWSLPSLRCNLPLPQGNNIETWWFLDDQTELPVAFGSSPAFRIRNCHHDKFTDLVVNTRYTAPSLVERTKSTCARLIAKETYEWQRSHASDNYLSTYYYRTYRSLYSRGSTLLAVDFSSAKSPCMSLGWVLKSRLS